MSILPASSLAFVFRIDSDTTTFLLLTVRSHLDMRPSKCANVPSFSLLRFGLFPCVFRDSMNFSLFLIQVDSAFFGMSYFITTWSFYDLSSTYFKASYFSLIDFVLSFLFVVTVAIVRCKHNDSRLNLPHPIHARRSYNTIRISKPKTRVLLTLQCKIFIKLT